MLSGRVTEMIQGWHPSCDAIFREDLVSMECGRTKGESEALWEEQ